MHPLEHWRRNAGTYRLRSQVMYESLLAQQTTPIQLDPWVGQQDRALLKDCSSQFKAKVGARQCCDANQGECNVRQASQGRLKQLLHSVWHRPSLTGT